MPWDLEIKKEEDTVAHLTLRDGMFTIGRDNGDIKIDDNKASKQHCNLYVQGDEISIIDAGSTNGTFVNGIRIDKKDLRHNDVVVIGTTRIRVLKC